MITLERATEKDIPTLLQTEKTLVGLSTYSPALEMDEWVSELKRSVVYLIRKDGVVVGNVSYERKGGDVYLSGFAIEPEFQRQGIGREVLRQLLEELKDFTHISLATHPDNESALKLYHSFGFTVESRKENYFGDGEPRLIMVLKKKRTIARFLNRRGTH